MDVEPVIDTRHEIVYGEVEERKDIQELTVLDSGDEVTIPATTSGAFEHRNGYLLKVETNIFFGEPEITVETASESLEDGYDYQSWRFESFTRFSDWVSQNATVRRS